MFRQKHIFLNYITKLKIGHPPHSVESNKTFELLILLVYKTCVTYMYEPCNGLWLSGKALERTIHISEVSFLIGTQNFPVFHACKKIKNKRSFIDIPRFFKDNQKDTFRQNLLHCDHFIFIGFEKIPLPSEAVFLR